jgi:ADP-ribose pyrophosphatase YjhB (NUDIX family)
VPISPYLRDLRAVVGRRLLLLPGVSAVIRDDAERVLFMRRADDGRWGLPAGAVDPGESPAEAIVREVREETGLVVRPVRVAGVFGGAGYRHRYPNGDEAEWTVAAFECEVVGGELAPRDGEALELRYFAPEEAPALQLPYPRSLFERPSARGAARSTLFV